MSTHAWYISFQQRKISIIHIERLDLTLITHHHQAIENYNDLLHDIVLNHLLKNTVCGCFIISSGSQCLPHVWVFQLVLGTRIFFLRGWHDTGLLKLCRQHGHCSCGEYKHLPDMVVRNYLLVWDGCTEAYIFTLHAAVLCNTIEEELMKQWILCISGHLQISFHTYPSRNSPSSIWCRSRHLPRHPLLFRLTYPPPHPQPQQSIG